MSALADYYAAQSGQIRDQGRLGQAQLSAQINQNRAQNDLASRAQDLQAAQIGNQATAVNNEAKARQDALNLAGTNALIAAPAQSAAAAATTRLANAQADDLTNPAKTDFLGAQARNLNSQTAATTNMFSLAPPITTPNAPAVGNSFMDSLMALRNGTYGQIPGHAGGDAMVEGTHASDVVPAMLAPGEAVLNKAAAEHLGRGVISHLNNMGMLKMAADRAAAGGSTSQVQTTSDGQDMHQAMTQPTHSFADGSPYVTNQTNLAVDRAQAAQGGGMVGLGGGILDGVNPFTGNKIFAGPSGPIGQYTGPSAADLAAQRAAATPPQPTYFAVPAAPAGFQGMQAPQHFAKGKAKVSKGGGGKAPMPDAAQAPQAQQPQQAQAPQPQSPMQGGTDQMPMPMQNYAMGTEEVRPNAELMPGGMPMGSGYAKGTAKVPPAKAAAKQKAAAKMAGKPASKPMPMPAQSPQLPVPSAQQASSMPQASIPAMPTMPVM